MAQNNISELSTTPASNTDFGGIGIIGTSLISTADDAFRTLGAIEAKWWSDLGGVNTVAGTGDAITVTTPTVYTALKTGMRMVFIASAANTTAVTLNLDAIGAKAVRKISGGVDVALAAGDLPAGARIDVIYNAAANSAAGAWIILSISVAAATTSASGIVELATVAEALAGTDAVRAVTPAGLYYPTGHLFGLTLTNSGSDSIILAAGDCRSDDDTANINQASTLTKSVATSWAVGSGNGGLDTGSVGNSRYFIWKIKRSDTSVDDALFSLSSTAPTMPTNYDKKTLIGEFTRAGAANGPPIWYGARRASGIYDGCHVLSAGPMSGASLDIPLTSFIGYRGIIIELINAIPVTDQIDLWMRFSTNGGSSYDAGATDYKWAYNQTTSVNNAINSTGDTKIIVAQGIGNGTAEGVSATIKIMGQTNVAIKTKTNWQALAYSGASDVPLPLTGGGYRDAAQDTDAVRLLPSSGNWSSGGYVLLGIL